MSKRGFLMGLMLAMSAFMTYTVIATSLQSNLLTEWSHLSAIPWMTATVKDFYQNLFLLWLWVLYKEEAFWKALVWGVLMVLLGSIVTPLYVFWQLKKLRPEQSLNDVWGRT